MPADPVESPSHALCALVGTTAAGKTAIAVHLAQRVGAEIVSVDSMQVYRGMDVGTAKPDAATRARAPHHVVDCADPHERYDVSRYLEDASAALATLRARGVPALFAGGTGLYLKALTHGLYSGPPADLGLRGKLQARARAIGPLALHAELAAVDPGSAERIHRNDERRVVRALEVWRQTGRPLSDWQREWRGPDASAAEGRARRLVGLEVAPDELDRRIAQRTRALFCAGWIDEVRAIRDGAGFGATAIQALGYREVLAHLDGALGRGELEELVRLRTRQFARRQRTWFRHFPDIRWIPAPAWDDPSDVELVAERAADALGWS